jgi:sodium/bile acid cotransporter 7
MMDQFAGFGASIQLPVLDMIKKLVVTVLFPIALGKVIAASSVQAKSTIKKYNAPLTYLSHIFVILTPWIQISNSALKGTFALVALADLLVAMAAGAFLHIVLLLMNYVGTKMIGLSVDMCKSVVFVASSKTMPLSLTVLTILPPGLGDKGLIALPIILSHFSQIIIDSFVVATWKTEKSDAERDAK